MTKLRVGVMGCASIAERLVIPAILELEDKLELKFIASRTEEKAAALASRFGVQPIVGYENLIDRSDIDVIYMPLPTGLHEEWVTKTLEAGKHILAEKSLATDKDSADRMVEMAISKRLLLMENFMFLYHSQHEWVKKQLKEQAIGEMRLFRSQFGFPPLDRNNFRYNKSLGGGALLDAGAYTLKASQLYLGHELEVTTATLYIDRESQVDMWGNASLINSKGQVSQVSFGFDNHYQCNYELWGSRGKILADRAFTPKPVEKPVMFLEQLQNKQRVEMEPDNHFKNLWRSLYDHVMKSNFDGLYQELLAQSRLLTDVREKSIKIAL